MSEQGHPESISYTPNQGYRDVHWCWIVGEPIWLAGPEGRLMCPECGWDEPAENPSDTFLGQHPFVCHVQSPSSARLI
jgi:hypothetical protein